MSRARQPHTEDVLTAYGDFGREHDYEGIPPGPTCYQDLFTWPDHLLHNFANVLKDDHGRNLETELQRQSSCTDTWFIYSRWSGVGTAHTAATSP